VPSETSATPATAATPAAPMPPTDVIEGIQGDNGFIATRDWIHQWQSKLPIEPILRLLDFFIPRIDAICETTYTIIIATHTHQTQLFISLTRHLCT
jgi:hypothetical protein